MKVFLDLGTHNCQGLRHFTSKLLPVDNTWEIHCFEPNPMEELFACINAFDHPNLTLHNKAVWVKDGPVVFQQFGPNGHSQGSTLKDTGAGKHYSDYHSEFTTEAVDFHKFILENFQKEDDLYIKMDIEWAEYEVIAHMLKEGWPENIKSIWIEWHFLHWPGHKERSEELEGLIKETGTIVETTDLYINY